MTEPPREPSDRLGQESTRSATPPGPATAPRPAAEPSRESSDRQRYVPTRPGTSAGSTTPLRPAAALATGTFGDVGLAPVAAGLFGLMSAMG
ncbi:hypothetical protein, partial [Streptomyces sp. Agncl-13]|uniref:hypothetical protein n=1 Tax=Streptomyces sp. Agncl-13 TaxID=3400628 RepID=UPI003A84DF2F